MLEQTVMPRLSDPIRLSATLSGTVDELVRAIRIQKLEGLVAKRMDAWMKMRVNVDQEFVIGGYTVGGRTFDALVFGYYEGDRLLYVARTSNGFTPALRSRLMDRFRGLGVEKCPFANLPEARRGR